MNYNSPGAISLGISAGAQNQAARERDPNCIEMHLKSIEAELGESLNSAENLADKLRGTEKAPSPCQSVPTGSDIHSRLQVILDAVRRTNSELSRAHSAISG